MRTQYSRDNESDASVGDATSQETNGKASLILAAATHVLTDEGYAGFGMRRVAARANISLGTLQYYFLSIDRLLSATVADVMSRFNRETELIVESDGSADERIDRFVTTVLAQIKDPKSAGVVFEMLALGQRVPNAGVFVTAALETYRDQMVRLLREARPDLTHDHLVVRATVICAQLEGLLHFYHAGGPAEVEWSILCPMIRSSVLATALAP